MSLAPGKTKTWRKQMKMKFQPPEHEREADEICMKNVPCPCVNPCLDYFSLLSPEGRKPWQAQIEAKLERRKQAVVREPEADVLAACRSLPGLWSKVDELEVQRQAGSPIPAARGWNTRKLRSASAAMWNAEKTVLASDHDSLEILHAKIAIYERDVAGQRRRDPLRIDMTPMQSSAGIAAILLRDLLRRLPGQTPPAMAAAA